MNFQHDALSESELDEVIGGNFASDYKECPFGTTAGGWPGTYAWYAECSAPPKTLGACIEDFVSRFASPIKTF